MEIKTIIEDSQSATFQVPVFKHPFYKMSKRDSQAYSLSDISIPDKIILQQNSSFSGSIHEKKCIILYGFELNLDDWKKIIDHHKLNENVGFDFSIIKFKGNLKKKIDEGILKTKSFLKGQKIINESLQLTDKNDKNEGLSIYRVNLGKNENIVIYYIPFCEKNNISMSQIKLRYFNNKFLQILNEYVTLDNTNTACYKDEAHQNFQYLVYSGSVASFTVFIQINDKILKTSNLQICERFIQKISGISLTDKHLLDQMDTSNLVELKKQIKEIYLQQNRLRINITEKKTKVVEQLDLILQLFDLKNHYPHKLNFSHVNSEMFRKIRNKNIQKNQQWILERKIINDNLDLRMKDLQKIKVQLLQKELINQEKQRIIIQNIRNQIIDLEKKIQFQRSQINNRLFEESRKEREKERKQKETQKHKRAEKKMRESTVKVNEASMKKQTIHQIEIFSKKYSQVLQEMKQQEKLKNLKSEMIKSQFANEKQFVQKREDYAKAAEQIFTYLIDF